MMAEPNPLPRFTQSLAVFVGDLRAWVFSSQVKAARYFGLTHSTVSRYESGNLVPPLGYLARLAHLLVDRLANEGQSVEGYKEILLLEINRTLRLYYPDEKSFRDWNELCCLAKDHMAKHQGAKSRAQPASGPRADWGTAPDVSVFYGRTRELAELAQSVVTERCRLVSVLGMGGMGKTALVTKLAEQVQDQFDRVIWRSLRNAPPIDLVLDDLLQAISGSPGYNASESVDQKISRLIERLRENRCLLVLDEVEAILRKDDMAGHYRDRYEAYGDMMRRIAETLHQSCLLLTSREKPTEISRLEGKSSPVRTLFLGGLSQDDGKKILEDKDLTVSEEISAVLVNSYSGNPLALKFAADTIQQVFAGDIQRFLDVGNTILGSVRQLFDQQFDRLARLELEIVYWLAVERQVISADKLCENMVPPVPTGIVVEALQSLRQRSLIEQSGHGFTLHTVVLQYVTDRLVDRVCDEVIGETPRLLQSHSLIGAQKQEHIRQNQIHFILRPIAQRLVTTLGQAALEIKLKHLLAMLRADARVGPGYAAGNILNLLIHLKYDVRGYDFSRLTIRQAYLRDAALPEVSFAGADLAQSVFTDAFVGVSTVAFSPDGKLLAAGTGSEICLWQVANAQPYAILKGHADLVWAVAFSPDGQTLASASADQTVQVWDVRSGESLCRMRGHTSWVWSVAFSPDGETLASSGEDQTVRLWDVHTGQALQILEGHTDKVFAIAYSPDGKLVASGSADQTVRLWDVRTGQVLHVLKGHADKVFSITFSPDGKIVASGSYDNTIRLWDVQAGQILVNLERHTGAVSAVLFSLDGATLVSGSYDCSIDLWDIRRDVICPRRVLRGHTQEVRAVAQSPDGKTLASASYDHTIRLWDMETGQTLQIWHGYSQEIRSIAFSPDGRTLASGGSDQAIHLWDVLTGQVYDDLRGHSRWVTSVAFSPDGRTLASGSYDRTVRLWNISTGQALSTLHQHSHWVWFVAFSPDGKLLCSGGADPTVHLWDIRTGQTLQTLTGHGHGVGCAAFSPDGETLATGSEDNAVHLWNVQTGQRFGTLRGHTHLVSCVAFSPTVAVLASASADQTIRLWDARSGQVLHTLRGHTGAISTIAFSPDGHVIASGSDDQSLRLWDAHTGQTLGALPGQAGAVLSAAFSPDGATLASAGPSGEIKLWSMRSGECSRTLRIARPYEQMNITGATGLTELQKRTLKALGAIAK